MEVGAYVINLDGKQSKETRWVSLFIYRQMVLYFDSFGIGHIPQEVLRRIKDKSITHYILRIQDGDSITCEFYYIAFREYMLA